MIYRKTTFLKFMLVQLISVLQVILLCDNSHSYLFYHGTMYFQLPDTGLRDLAACGEHNTPPYGHLSTWTIGQVVLNIIQVSGRSRRVRQTPFNEWVVDLDGGASARNASMEYEGIDARARP